MADIASIRSGFRFQDVIALAYFFDYIKDISSIIDEGNNDVEIIFNDGSITYIQAKYANKVNTPGNRSTKANDAINSLIKNYFSALKHHKNIKSYIYATNSNFPFGVPKGTKRLDITLRSRDDYLSSTKDLLPEVQNNIKQRVTKFIKQNSDNNRIISNGRNNKSRFLKKFLIFKYFYQGIGKYRLVQIVRDVDRFVGTLLLKHPSNAPVYSKNLMHFWLDMLNDNSTNGKSYTIKKHTFVAYTTFSIVKQEQGQMTTFFNKINLGLKGMIAETGQIDDINQSESDIKTLFLMDFYTCSKLHAMFCRFETSYRKNHGKIGFIDVLCNFINSPKEIKHIKLHIFDTKEDICIIQYVAWELIMECNAIQRVEHATGFENSELVDDHK